MGGVKRRDFLAGCSAGMLTPFVAGATTVSRKKTNLLFVFTDQQAFDMIGSVNPQVHTPNLDALADRGVRFEHAISNFPVCTPYRGMLLSGQHPLVNGAFSNDVPLLPCPGKRFGHVLSEGGYDVAYIGKWHLYGGKTRDAAVPPGPNRQGFDGVFLSNNIHVDFRPDACYYWNDAGEKVFFKDIYPDQPWELEAQTRQVEEWFDRREKTDPFALFVSWHPPHDFRGDCCDDLPGHQRNYDVDELDPRLLAPYDGREISLRPGSVFEGKMDDCKHQQYRNYMAMVTACDAAVGRLVDKLKEQGFYENTLIVFTSDHGDMLGSHGAKYPKPYPQNYALKVPLIMHCPNRLLTGRVSELPIGAMDLMPTILGMLDLPIPDVVQGKDFSRAILTGDDSVAESQPIFNCGGWRGVYTKEWTYARGVDGAKVVGGVEINLLYNHAEDPGQLNNLFGDSRYAQIQEEMEKLTVQWLEYFEDEEYTGADFTRVEKETGISWKMNYAHRPIDLLKKVCRSS